MKHLVAIRQWLGLGGCLLLASPLYASNDACQALANQNIAGIKYSTEFHAPDDQTLVPYCLLKGSLADRTGIDGKPYAIGFELRLPENWQGRFAYQFNGGNDGEVKPALGSSSGLTIPQYAVNQGFAVVSSNGGHDGKANPEAGLVGGALFGWDPQARSDYGYAAVQKLNPVARHLIEEYYKTPIRYSYGIGSSNGGRMAMVSASRFPDMFDGLLIGYPGFNLPKAAIQHAWDIQALHRVNNNISQALTKRDLQLFSKSVLDQCDALDGVKDDMVFASDACQKVFKPTALVCKSEFDHNCLPVEKIAAIIRMHQGPHNSKGQALYSDWVYDAGIRGENWRLWKVESPIEPWSYKPIIDVMGAASLASVFTTPPVKVAGNPYSLESYLLHFDFDKDAPKIFAKNSVYTESAMDFMTPPDVDKPTLEGFKQHGSKMILFHGNSDPVFSVKDTVKWYNKLDWLQYGKASQFVRLYRVPGMPHGQGGPSTDQFDMLQPLINWVEKGQAPQSIVAATRVDNPDITERMVGLTRPLCPYPAHAQYNQGNVRAASSFICVL